jgi:dTDP-4-dehydrorhamnose 3,5-epimerase-like enzyme
MNYKIINFQVKGDRKGSLISLEEKKNIPFSIKRVYYIYHTAKNAVRGKHAHRNLHQVIIAVSGSCKFLLDDGQKKKTVTLDSPEKGLYIGKDIWREMYDFSSDCVLMVLASEYYDENEYERDYQKFKNGISDVSFEK